jgi:hypothetical protein
VSRNQLSCSSMQAGAWNGVDYVGRVTTREDEILTRICMFFKRDKTVQFSYHTEL